MPYWHRFQRQTDVHIVYCSIDSGVLVDSARRCNAVTHDSKRFSAMTDHQIAPNAQFFPRFYVFL